MDLQEPIWRQQIREAAREACPRLEASQIILMRLIQEYLCDGFDPLVQAISRRDLETAREILVKHYPGSLERQEGIEHILRGSLDG